MNKTVNSLTRFAAAAALSVAVWGCEATKSSNPLSPTVAGPIAGVGIDAPVPVSPTNGAEVVNSEPLRLVFNNATTNGVRPLRYKVELGSDAEFSSILFASANVAPGEGGRTTVVVDGTLSTERTYFWRAKATDGANESSFSSTARFDLVVPVVIEAPALVSPVGGQVVSSTSPTLTVNNGRVVGRTGEVIYRYSVAQDAAFSRMVAELNIPRSSGSQTSTPIALPENMLLFWRVVATNGTVRDTSATQSFRTPAPAAPAPGPGPSPSPVPTPPPGTPACVGGLLVNPREYFFQLIGRKEGDSARDWASVLQRSGIPAGPVAHQKIPPNAPFYGITQQINSSGEVRGRLFLPTEVPDAHGYYIYQVDILSDASATSWVWRPLGGPPYVPRRCP
jgi:hypothetical protein